MKKVDTYTLVTDTEKLAGKTEEGATNEVSMSMRGALLIAISSLRGAQTLDLDSDEPFTLQTPRKRKKRRRNREAVRV